MPSPLVEAGIEQQACLGLYRFHEAVSVEVCHLNDHCLVEQIAQTDQRSISTGGVGHWH